MGVIKLGVKQQTFPEVALLVHCLQIKLEFYIIVFVEVGKPENAENKNQQSKDNNQQQTQCQRTVQELNHCHSDGRRTLLPLVHYCSYSPDKSKINLGFFLLFVINRITIISIIKPSQHNHYGHHHHYHLVITTSLNNSYISKN